MNLRNNKSQHSLCLPRWRNQNHAQMNFHILYSCLCLSGSSKILRTNQFTFHYSFQHGLGNSFVKPRSDFSTCQFDKMVGKNLETALLSQYKELIWGKSLEKKIVFKSVVWSVTSPINEGKGYIIPLLSCSTLAIWKAI